jgi:hypothetical protein
MNPDTISTASGGALGLYLLNTVQWNLVPYGEAVKVAIAFAFIMGGYFMYRKDSK